MDIPTEEYLALRSPAHQYYANYEELTEEPRVFTPNRDYDQKNEGTIELDIPLTRFWKELSTRARIAWRMWLAQLNKTAEEVMLTPEEQIEYTRYRRMVLREDLTWKREEREPFERVVENTIACTFAKTEKSVDTYISREILRFKDEVQGWEIIDTSLGSSDIVVPLANSLIKVGDYLEFPDIERDVYTTSVQEWVEQYTMMDHQTSIWRSEYQHGEPDDAYFPNTGATDDVDFTPPLSLKSKFSEGGGRSQFTCGEPAYRPYNCTFLVEFTDGTSWLSKPKSSKDYTTKETLRFIISKEERFKDKELKKITQITESPEFEPDIRQSPGSYPKPKEYKKIDAKSDFGLFFLRMLLKSPYCLDYKAWNIDVVTEKGETKKATKVALCWTFSNKKGKLQTLWCYLNNRDVGSSFIKRRIIQLEDRVDVKVTWKARKKQIRVEFLTMRHLHNHSLVRVGMTVFSDPSHPEGAVARYALKYMKQEDFIFVREELRENGRLRAHIFLKRGYLTKKDRDKNLMCPMIYSILSLLKKKGKTGNLGYQPTTKVLSN
jgi:hypothetical protein